MVARSLCFCCMTARPLEKKISKTKSVIKSKLSRAVFINQGQKQALPQIWSLSWETTGRWRQNPHPGDRVSVLIRNRVCPLTELLPGSEWFPPRLQILTVISTGGLLEVVRSWNLASWNTALCTKRRRNWLVLCSVPLSEMASMYFLIFNSIKIHWFLGSTLNLAMWP